MSEAVSTALRRLVRQRTRGRCEYCLLHDDDTMLSNEADHIICTKHGGQTDEANLAWSCFLCNRFKGSDLTSIDVETGRIERLFYPRTDDWIANFRIEDGFIVALTTIGRVTEYLLRFNLPENVELRRVVMRIGAFPR